MKNKTNTRSVVVTGATAGIGFQTALDFAKSGAFVIGVGRDPQRNADALGKISEAVPGAMIHFLIADLASQKQIRSLSDQIGQILDKNGFSSLDVLVNNAGLYMGKKVLTEDKIEKTFAVNHLAPFLLTILILPRLSNSSDGRVITVSSDSHYNTRFIPEKAKDPKIFFGLWAYKVSKICNVLFSLEFNRRQKGKFPHAFAMDPGLVNTEIGLKETGGLAQIIWRNRKNLGVSPEVPAQTILFLANDPEAPNSSATYWHRCKPKQPDRLALNLKYARRLWIESCKLCEVTTDFEGESL